MAGGRGTPGDVPTTWSAWKARARLVDADPGVVATYDLGAADRPVVTYLHGYPSASLDVAPVLGELGDAARVVTLDFPGFGASAKPDGHRYSIHAAADAVELLWRTTGVERCVLLAHDYGATVAQELVARRLDDDLTVDLGGVVWTNGGVYPDLHRPTVGQQLLLDPDDGPALAAGVTEELFVEGLRGTWGTRVPFPDDVAHEIWSSMDDAGGVARMHDLLHYVADRRQHGDRWRAALESSAVPAWFVWGDVDPVSGAHMVERIEQRRADAPIERMADVGHWPPLEAPAEVAAALRAALAG